MKRGQKHTEDTKRKIGIATSSSLKGHIHSVETKRKIGLAMKGHGHPQSKETKAKLRLANLGKSISLECRKKISLKMKGKTPWIKGRKMSPEFCEKISIAFKGKPSKKKGKKISEEQKKKISISLGGSGNRPLKKQIRGIFQYQNWRKSIFERDNYVCQLCNKRGGKLNVDHYPTTFAEIVRKYDFKNLEEAINCPALWDMKNGRTLCFDCHKKTPTFLRNISKNEEAIPREARKMGLEVEGKVIETAQGTRPYTEGMFQNKPGVWWKIKMPKDRARMPVEAFGAVPFLASPSVFGRRK